MKPKIAIIRGKFLNRYEMQFYEPLVREFDITAFGSEKPFHDRFAFPVVKCKSPMDLPDFPLKMPVLNRLFTDAQYLFGLEEKLRGFDIAHTAETYYRYTQQCLNAKRKGYVKKVIATVLENIPFNNEGIRGRRAYKKRAREELDHMIALTNKTKEVLIAEGADPGKITVISHFIDTTRFLPHANNESPRNITVLFAGRLEIYKGVYDILIAANKLLHDPALSKYRVKFVFAGTGTVGRNMTILEDQLGIGQFIKHITAGYDGMPAVYQSADIFVAPSRPTPTWEEQYNTSLLEAQASGLAIVTTRSGGIPENIGDAGILVNPGDADGLMLAVKNFILDPDLRTQYGKSARDRAVKVHDAKIGARKLADLYHHLLS
jgi:glycosyltransferase involved in cell wall biosynthesis